MDEVENYILQYADDIQERLYKLRHLIKAIAPHAEEKISYAIPAYKVSGKPLAYFAAYKDHIGLYAAPSAQKAFIEKLSKYKQGKGSVQFPLDSPMPYDLIEEIVRYKLNEISSGGK
jgi:uncharacterized protein YdhG (YjbR/CyaY superfamily)